MCLEVVRLKHLDGWNLERDCEVDYQIEKISGKPVQRRTNVVVRVLADRMKLIFLMVLLSGMRSSAGLGFARPH